MMRFMVSLIGDGFKGHKQTENRIEFYKEEHNDFSMRIKKLKANHCILVKQYPENADVFELEKKFRKVINGGTRVDWCLLDDGSFLVVKFTVKGNNKVNNWFRNEGFEEMAV